MAMRFFHAKQSDIVYIRTPKTAGTTMQKYFLMRYKFEPIKAYPRLTSWSVGKSKKFMVVRNPWDRAVSHYEHLRRTVNFYKKFTFAEHCKEMDGFNLRRITDNFIKINELDFYIRFEDLDKEVNEKLYKGSGHTLVKERLQVSPREHKNYRDYYDQETIDLVANLNKDVIDTIGYDF